MTWEDVEVSSVQKEAELLYAISLNIKLNTKLQVGPRQSHVPILPHWIASASPPVPCAGRAKSSRAAALSCAQCLWGRALLLLGQGFLASSGNVLPPETT